MKKYAMTIDDYNLINSQYTLFFCKHTGLSS